MAHSFDPLRSDDEFTSLDLGEVEFLRRQRQLINELTMQRDQVKQLSAEVDATNLKNFELKRALDVAKSESNERELNLNVALQHIQTLEDKLQKNRDAEAKIRVQQDSIVAERDTLREILQKSEMKNYEIHRQLEELQMKQKCDRSYQNELMAQDRNMWAVIAKLSNAMQELDKEQKGICAKFTNVQMMEDLQRMVMFYKGQLEIVKKNNLEIQGQFIAAKAEAGTFALLTNSFPLGFNTALKQQENCTIHLESKCTHLQEQLDHVQDQLDGMKITNEKLCLQQFAIEQENEELKKRLQNSPSKDQCDIQVQTDAEEMVTKCEVIEIN